MRPGGKGLTALPGKGSRGQQGRPEAYGMGDGLSGVSRRRHRSDQGARSRPGLVRDWDGCEPSDQVTAAMLWRLQAGDACGLAGEACGLLDSMIDVAVHILVDIPCTSIPSWLVQLPSSPHPPACPPAYPHTCIPGHLLPPLHRSSQLVIRLVFGSRGNVAPWPPTCPRIAASPLLRQLQLDHVLVRDLWDHWSADRICTHSFGWAGAGHGVARAQVRVGHVCTCVALLERGASG